MLSDAKLRALAIEHREPWLLVAALCRAVSEATAAAERERLGVLGRCDGCGDLPAVHTDDEGGVLCVNCYADYRVAAERERLHLESGVEIPMPTMEEIEAGTRHILADEVAARVSGWMIEVGARLREKAERELLTEKIKALEDHSERMELGIGMAKLHLDQGEVAKVRKALAYATEKSDAVVAVYSKDRLHPEAGEGG